MGTLESGELLDKRWLPQDNKGVKPTEVRASLEPIGVRGNKVQPHFF